MGYSYTEMRPKIFTEEGTKALVSMRDKMREYFKTAGACTIWSLFTVKDAAADSWLTLAIIDYLVEKQECKKIELPERFSQYWVLVPFSV